MEQKTACSAADRRLLLAAGGAAAAARSCRLHSVPAGDIYYQDRLSEAAFGKHRTSPPPGQGRRLVHDCPDTAGNTTARQAKGPEVAGRTSIHSTIDLCLCSCKKLFKSQEKDVQKRKEPRDVVVPSGKTTSEASKSESSL